MAAGAGHDPARRVGVRDVGVPVMTPRILPEMTIPQFVAAFKAGEITADEADNSIWAYSNSIREWQDAMREIGRL